MVTTRQDTKSESSGNITLSADFTIVNNVYITWVVVCVIFPFVSLFKEGKIIVNLHMESYFTTNCQ